MRAQVTHAHVRTEGIPQVPDKLIHVAIIHNDLVSVHRGNCQVGSRQQIARIPDLHLNHSSLQAVSAASALEKRLLILCICCGDS